MCFWISCSLHSYRNPFSFSFLMFLSSHFLCFSWIQGCFAMCPFLPCPFLFFSIQVCYWIFVIKLSFTSHFLIMNYSYFFLIPFPLLLTQILFYIFSLISFPYPFPMLFLFMSYAFSYRIISCIPALSLCSTFIWCFFFSFVYASRLHFVYLDLDMFRIFSLVSLLSDVSFFSLSSLYIFPYNFLGFTYFLIFLKFPFMSFCPNRIVCKYCFSYSPLHILFLIFINFYFPLPLSASDVFIVIFP